MGSWLEYSLADFLLFSPATYWRLFELMNTAVWPLTFGLPALLAAVTIAAAMGWRHTGWFAGLALALCWALVAHLFLATHYATINWAVAWIIPMAWAQAALLSVLGPGLRFPGSGEGRLAYGIIALALAYPVIGLIAGRPIVQSEIAGLAPDPTAILTIGLAALARPGWRVLVLSILPIGWLGVSATTLFAMRESTGWVLLVVLVCASWNLWRPARGA